MKTLASLLLTFSLLFAMSPNTLAFDDIRSPILEEAVNYLSAEGIIKGYPDGTFKPEQTINRAEALKIIFESLGEGGLSGNPSSNPFPDVDASLWFAQYVKAAKDRGLIKGYPDGTYKPTQSVNRVEFVKIAMLAQSHYESIQNSIASNQYSDLDANEWYMPYIAFGVYRNFLNESDRFQPTEAMSRGDAALIIYRIAQYNNENASQSDNQQATASCTGSMCVNGVDLSQYEWINSEVASIENGKIYSYGSEVTGMVVAEPGTIQLTAASESSLKQAIKAGEFYKDIDEVSDEDKKRIDELYPEYWERIMAINGGKQSFDSLLTSGKYPIYLKNGKKTSDPDCDCQFERNVLSAYNGHGYELDFYDWRETDVAKIRLYEEIRIDINSQQQ